MKLNALKVHNRRQNELFIEKLEKEREEYEKMTDEEKAEYDKKREEKKKELWRLLNFPAYVSELLHQKPYK